MPDPRTKHRKTRRRNNFFGVHHNFLAFCKKCVIIPAELLEKSSGAIAQLVEQMTFNHWVQGSSPCGPTKKSKPHLRFLFFGLGKQDENPWVRHDS